MSPRGRFTSAWDERISLGIEQKIPILELTALTGGAGLRLGPVHLEVSAGTFDADGAAVAKDGLYGTVALQIKGGGL